MRINTPHSPYRSTTRGISNPVYWDTGAYAVFGAGFTHAYTTGTDTPREPIHGLNFIRWNEAADPIRTSLGRTVFRMELIEVDRWLKEVG
jgi:hypothetical protein